MGVHLSSKQVVGTVNPWSFWPGIFVLFYSLKCRGVKNVSKMAIQWQFTIFTSLTAFMWNDGCLLQLFCSLGLLAHINGRHGHA